MGVSVAVAVAVGIGSVVVATGIKVGVADGIEPPARTMRGAIHTARSPLGEPLASTSKKNSTFLPARDDRSRLTL